MAYIPGTNNGDTKIGGAENDYIFGFGGVDLLFGGFGNEHLWRRRHRFPLRRLG